MQTRRSYTRHRKPEQRSTLTLRFGICLMLLALVFAVRRWEPALLEPLQEQLLSNTGEVAEAFARFTASLGDGEPVVEAWSALQEELSAVTAAQEAQ